MIDAKSLRIGNWMQYLSGGYFQVAAEDFILLQTTQEHLLPKYVELSEDILIKAGFERELFGNLKTESFYSTHHKMIGVHKVGGNNQDWQLSINDRSINTLIQSLDQLQNIHYFIIGTELNIQL